MGVEFVRLAQYGKFSALKYLLDRHQVPIDIRGDEGGTALHWACRNGHETVVRLLISKGAELDARCARGATPLHWAVYEGHDAIVQFLLEAGWYLVPSLVYRRDHCGLVPLHWVAQKGNQRSLELLLSHGADMYAEDSKAWTPFIQAIMVGHQGMLKELIRRGFKNHRNSRGFAPLNQLVEKGFISLVKFWLAHGTDVTLQDRLGRNILHHAAHYGCTDLVVFLAQTTRLDLDAKSKLGAPLYLAIAKGRIGVVKALMRNGACVDIKDHFGNTPLHTVVQKSYVDWPRYKQRARCILHALLDFGVNIDKKAQNMFIMYGGAQYFTGCQYEEMKRKIISIFVPSIDALGKKYHTSLPLDLCRLIALFMVTASDEA